MWLVFNPLLYHISFCPSIPPSFTLIRSAPQPVMLRVFVPWRSQAWILQGRGWSPVVQLLILCHSGVFVHIERFFYGDCCLDFFVILEDIKGLCLGDMHAENFFFQE